MEEKNNGWNAYMTNDAYEKMVLQAKQDPKPEKQNQYSLGTLLLLVVGSLFVAVAASIFAVKAWPHLDHMGKVVLMILATAICYGLSFLAERKLQIKGSASALYYLGTALSGVTMWAIFDDACIEAIVNQFNIYHSTVEQGRLLGIYIFMLIPLAIRMMQKKYTVDAIFSISLFDLCIGILLDMMDAEFLVIMAVICIVHSIILVTYQNMKEVSKEKSLLLGLKIMVMLHTVFSFLFVSFIGMFWACFSTDEESWIMVMIMAASFAGMFWYYCKNKSILSLIATLAQMICLTVALAGMDLNIIPDEIIVEKVVLFLAVGVWGLKPVLAVKYPGKNTALEIIRFCLNCLLMMTLLCHNIADGELINVLILGIVSAILLVWAVSQNQKGYLILSAVTLILLVLYVTKEFWMAISWWIYLLIVGIAMIVIAIMRERGNK